MNTTNLKKYPKLTLQGISQKQVRMEDTENGIEDTQENETTKYSPSIWQEMTGAA